jgi:hypothetical protein
MHMYNSISRMVLLSLFLLSILARQYRGFVVGMEKQHFLDYSYHSSNSKYLATMYLNTCQILIIRKKGNLIFPSFDSRLTLWFLLCWIDCPPSIILELCLASFLRINNMIHRASFEHVVVFGCCTLRCCSYQFVNFVQLALFQRHR